MFERKCPKCKTKLSYKYKYTRDEANRKQRCCRSCNSGFNKYNKEVSLGIKPNGFKNKSHTKEAKEKNKNWHLENSDKYKTDEFKKKISDITSGKNNPMFGKSIYDIWLAKYGKDEADKKLIQFKNKQSINASGKNNPMFGKPSPQGSGNGWKGWYNGIFFRSLLELSFLVNYIERFNMKMINAECKQYAIQYNDQNIIKTYFADYIINNKYLIEIKPKKLHFSYTVQLKSNAAIEYCKKNNLKYKLIDPIKIQKKQILDLMKNGKLIFHEKYHQKVLNY